MKNVTTKHGGQTRQILNHIKERGKITSVEAFGLYGVTRLSAKIYELRKEHGDGFIVSNRKQGVRGSYVEYRLGDVHAEAA